MDICSYNQEACNREAANDESRWTQPISADVVAMARKGEFGIVLNEGLSIEFGRSPTDPLGDQHDAGFVITDMYEDYMNDSPLRKYHPSYIATRAIK